mmetsp:Transcript_66415/g.107739  ORF Transcript_66415/g.107739 Transcript_66415/m.107739 type:complete len:769 (+) Transcript_66415:149-2455(+)
MPLLFLGQDLTQFDPHGYDESRRGGVAIPDTSHMSPGEHIRIWCTFFIVAMFARYTGPYMPRVGLPAIMGFMITGIIAGPFVLQVIKSQDILFLQYINMFALAFITTSAGAELEMKELRPILKNIVASTTCISVLSFGVCAGMVLALSDTSLLAQLMDGRSDSCRMGLALIMGTICMARSPATAIAIIKELRSKGKMTTTFLSITVLSDVYVLVAVSITVSIAQSACSGTEFKVANIGVVLGMIVVSILLGIPIGLFYIVLMRSTRFFVKALVFPMGFLIFLCSAFFATEVAYKVAPDMPLHIEALLICIMSGFVCVNHSKYHHRFIECLDTAAPFIMMPFFTLVGASINLPVFFRSLPFAFVMFVARAVCIIIGSAVPGYFLKQSKVINLTIWMTLLPQAGFELGLAATLATVFKPWGVNFQAIIISCVIVNLLFGSIVTKLALKWSKEAGMGSGHEAHDEAEADPNQVHIADINKCVILGTTNTSTALALSLLKERWSVVMFTLDEKEAEKLQTDVNDWAETQRAEHREYTDMFQLPPPVLPAVPIEDNFIARPVPLDGEKHPFMTSSGSLDDICAAACKFDEIHSVQATIGQATTCAAVAGPAPERQSFEDQTNKSLLPRAGSFDQRSTSVLELLAGLTGVKVVVLALGDDLAALSLCDKIQDHFRLTNSLHKVRFVVQMQETRWAEAFSMLDCIPTHDFVGSTKSIMLAAVTEYNKDCVLVEGCHMTGPDSMSSAFLNLFDGPLLNMCDPRYELPACLHVDLFF